MTTSFIARFSKEQDCPIVIITEDITDDFQSIHPDDDSHTGPTIDMFDPRISNGVLLGDWYVSQNEIILKATLQSRTGHVVTIEMDKVENKLLDVVTEPTNEWSEEEQITMVEFCLATVENLNEGL